MPGSRGEVGSRAGDGSDPPPANGMMRSVDRRLDMRLSFNEVPDIYDEIRPSYPGALYDRLFEMLPPQPTILEVGPGTGQATRDLLARGASVHAVEIGPATAARLRSNLPSDRLRVTVGDFEEVDLPPSSADALLSACAYHWISPGAQTDRPARLLRPGGVVAIVELTQVTSSADRGFYEAAQRIYDRYGEGHKGPPAPFRGDVDPPVRGVLENDGRFAHVVVRRWDWDQTYSAAEYRKLMLSFSVTQMMDPSERLGLLDDMEAFVNRHFGGQITRPLVATLTTAVVAHLAGGETVRRARDGRAGRGDLSPGPSTTSPRPGRPG